MNFGDVGWGSVSLNLTVKYYSPMTNVCIIRVARDQHNIAWAGLTMVTAIEGVRVIPNVVHLSGEYVVVHIPQFPDFRRHNQAGTAGRH